MHLHYGAIASFLLWECWLGRQQWIKSKSTVDLLTVCVLSVSFAICIGLMAVFKRSKYVTKSNSGSGT